MMHFSFSLIAYLLRDIISFCESSLSGERCYCIWKGTEGGEKGGGRRAAAATIEISIFPRLPFGGYQKFTRFSFSCLLSFFSFSFQDCNITFIYLCRRKYMCCYRILARKQDICPDNGNEGAAVISVKREIYISSIYIYIYKWWDKDKRVLKRINSH